VLITVNKSWKERVSGKKGGLDISEVVEVIMVGIAVISVDDDDNNGIVVELIILFSFVWIVDDLVGELSCSIVERNVDDACIEVWVVIEGTLEDERDIDGDDVIDENVDDTEDIDFEADEVNNCDKFPI